MTELIHSLISMALARVGRNEDDDVATLLHAAEVCCKISRKAEQDTAKRTVEAQEELERLGTAAE